MVRYELLILTIPEITKDEIAEIEKQFDRLVTSAQAQILSFERWGKYRLSFQVRKNDYGVYFLMRFQGQSVNQLLKDIDAYIKFKLNALIMRHMVTRLPDEGSLEYQRAESLEEMPPVENEHYARRSRSDSYAPRAHKESDQQREFAVESHNEEHMVEA